MITTQKAFSLVHEFEKKWLIEREMFLQDIIDKGSKISSLKIALQERDGQIKLLSQQSIRNDADATRIRSNFRKQHNWTGRTSNGHPWPMLFLAGLLQCNNNGEGGATFNDIFRIHYENQIISKIPKIPFGPCILVNLIKEHENPNTQKKEKRVAYLFRQLIKPLNLKVIKYGDFAESRKGDPWVFYFNESDSKIRFILKQYYNNEIDGNISELLDATDLIEDFKNYSLT